MNLHKEIYIEVHKGKYVSRIIGTEESIQTYSNHLKHPRSLAGDCEGIEDDLKVIFSKYNSFLDQIFKPRVVIHFIPKIDGGYTKSEFKIFSNACYAAGASRCIMCDAKFPPLSNDDLKDVLKKSPLSKKEFYNDSNL